MNHKQIEKFEFHFLKGIEKYAVVDSKGKVIMKFRGKCSADNYRKEIQKYYFDEKLKVVTIEINNTKSKDLNR